MALLFLLISLILFSLRTIEARMVFDLKEDSPHIEQIGNLVPCNAGEKRCFRHGRIYNAEDGKCYVVGSRANCPFGKLFLDRHGVLKNESYIGKCSNNQPCEIWLVKADDGNCMGTDIFCRNDKKFHESLFGDKTCININATVPYMEVQQPEKDGICRIPDFRVEEISIPIFEEYNSPCSNQELLCFMDQRVLWPGDERCYELLYTEPCEEGQWLVVDKERYGKENGRIIPMCQSTPCPKGEVLMQFDGKCHSEKEVLDVWCSVEVIYTNIFGESGCAPKGVGGYALPTIRNEEGLCIASYRNVLSVVQFSSKACPGSNSGYCPREIEMPEPDSPEL